MGDLIGTTLEGKCDLGHGHRRSPATNQPVVTAVTLPSGDTVDLRQQATDWSRPAAVSADPPGRPAALKPLLLHLKQALLQMKPDSFFPTSY